MTTIFDCEFGRVFRSEQGYGIIGSSHFLCVEMAKEIERLRGLIIRVRDELNDSDRNGPGHCHTIAGIWDKGNRDELAGKPCEWCRTWDEFCDAANSNNQQGTNQ